MAYVDDQSCGGTAKTPAQPDESDLTLPMTQRLERIDRRPDITPPGRYAYGINLDLVFSSESVRSQGAKILYIDSCKYNALMYTYKVISETHDRHHDLPNGPNALRSETCMSNSSTFFSTRSFN